MSRPAFRRPDRRCRERDRLKPAIVAGVILGCGGTARRGFAQEAGEIALDTISVAGEGGGRNAAGTGPGGPRGPCRATSPRAA